MGRRNKSGDDKEGVGRTQSLARVSIGRGTQLQRFDPYRHGLRPGCTQQAVDALLNNRIGGHGDLVGTSLNTVPDS